jgi:hypothetical protein
MIINRLGQQNLEPVGAKRLTTKGSPDLSGLALISSESCSEEVREIII